MPLNPQHHGSITLMDHDEEKSSFRFNFGPITVGTLVGFLSQFGALRTAVEGITLGVVTQEQWVGDTTKFNAAPPADKVARRETKWLVRYQDTVNFSVYTAEIPTADPSLTEDNSEEVDITAGAPAAFVSAFEAIARSPEGNGVNVLGMRYVGRNL